MIEIAVHIRKRSKSFPFTSMMQEAKLEELVPFSRVIRPLKEGTFAIFRALSKRGKKSRDRVSNRSDEMKRKFLDSPRSNPAQHWGTRRSYKTRAFDQKVGFIEHDVEMGGGPSFPTLSSSRLIEFPLSRPLSHS